MRTVNVPLGHRSYKIRIGEGLLDQLGKACAPLTAAGSCAVITDSNVGSLYGARVRRNLVACGLKTTLITVPAGETAKSLNVAQRCYDLLAAARVERKSLIVALGGGVVGDLAGFVAATYLRGVPFVQVPTTLLSQVDSSVGGKVGVNLRAGKNLVGSFHQPTLVVCDLSALRSLPSREFRSGLAEVIKYGIIYDARFFRELERDLDAILRGEPAILGRVIARCCAIKADVVGQDETESGLRAILNFGHTVGHALESVSGYGNYLHGEAISIGQVIAADLSAAESGLSREAAERIERILSRAGLPVRARLSGPAIRNLLEAMRLDKKVSGGKVKFVLAKAIGSVVFGQAVPEKALRSSLERFLRG